MPEALEDAGTDMLIDCRKGECGLCEVHIVELSGAVDHRDVFFSERQQRLGTKMNCCVASAVTSDTGAKSDAGHAGPAIVTIEPNETQSRQQRTLQTPAGAGRCLAVRGGMPELRSIGRGRASVRKKSGNASRPSPAPIDRCNPCPPRGHDPWPPYDNDARNSHRMCGGFRASMILIRESILP